MRILLITDSSGTNVKASLAFNGENEVIQKNSTQFTNEPYPTDIDVVVVVTISTSSLMASRFIEYVRITNTPALLGYLNYAGSGVGLNANNAWGMLGLCSSSGDPNGLNSVNVLTDHEVFFDSNLNTGSVFLAYGTSEYMTTAATQSYTTGAIHLGSASNGAPCFTYFPKGITTQNTTLLPVDVFTMGFLTDRVAMSLVAKDILKNTLEFLITKDFAVKGKVQDSQKNPLERNITVFDQETLKILGQTTSNSLGEFQIDLRRDTPVVVLVAPLNVNNNAQVRYNVIPQIKDQL